MIGVEKLHTKTRISQLDAGRLGAKHAVAATREPQEVTGHLPMSRARHMFSMLELYPAFRVEARVKLQLPTSVPITQLTYYQMTNQ